MRLTLLENERRMLAYLRQRPDWPMVELFVDEVNVLRAERGAVQARSKMLVELAIKLYQRAKDLEHAVESK